MSNHEKRVRIALGKINTQQEVDALEKRLKGLAGVRIHELGLSKLSLSYDQTKVDPSQIEQAIERAGGEIQEMRREE